MTFVLPLISLPMQVFSFSSIFSHDKQYYSDLFTDNINFVQQWASPNNLYVLNINWLAIDSIAEILSVITRLIFTIVGIYQT
jgi:hypothetical protein